MPTEIVLQPTLLEESAFGPVVARVIRKLTRSFHEEKPLADATVFKNWHFRSMFVQDLENCWRNFPHRVSKVLSRMNGEGQHCINMNGGRWRIDLHFNVKLPKHHGFDFYNA